MDADNSDDLDDTSQLVAAYLKKLETKGVHVIDLHFYEKKCRGTMAPKYINKYFNFSSVLRIMTPPIKILMSVVSSCNEKELAINEKFILLSLSIKSYE